MVLVIENIKKVFDDTTVLEKADFRFEKGKIYGLLGRNGSGKTTLFNCISQTIPIDEGRIYLEEEGREQPYNATDIGYVYAVPHLPSFMTGFEFIKYFMEVNQGRLREPNISPEQQLQSIGIKHEDQGKLLKDYSLGMKNKVQLLTSLLVRTPVILLDEPLTSFDPVSAHEIKQVILSLKEDTIVIFSTHVLQLAQDLCDEVVLLHHHQLRAVSENLHQPAFEADIVALLQEEE